MANASQFRREIRVGQGRHRAERQQPRGMAELAAGPRLGLAIEMRRHPARRDQGGPGASPAGPTRFRITASWWRAGSASGRPATARMCCSNWLARQASMVQWPELCGRGAISLPSSAPSGSRNISSASTPTRSERRRHPRRMARAAAAHRRRHARRGEAEVEDVVAVAVLHRVVDRERAVGAARRRWPRSRRRRARRLPGSAASAPAGRRPAAASSGRRSTSWPRPS